MAHYDTTWPVEQMSYSSFGFTKNKHSPRIPSTQTPFAQSTLKSKIQIKHHLNNITKLPYNTTAIKLQGEESFNQEKSIWSRQNSLHKSARFLVKISLS